MYIKVRYGYHFGEPSSPASPSARRAMPRRRPDCPMQGVE